MSLRAAAHDDAPLLAAIHADAFDAPWGAGEIETLLTSPGGYALLEGEDGFILCREVADEAEILTLAVRPEAWRRGIAGRLVEAAAVVAKETGAEVFFLEVAADNAAALALYRAAGFEEAGRRAAYYPRPGGAVDALVMRRALNRGG